MFRFLLRNRSALVSSPATVKTFSGAYCIRFIQTNVEPSDTTTGQTRQRNEVAAATDLAPAVEAVYGAFSEDALVKLKPRATRRKKSSLDSEGAGIEAYPGDYPLEPRPRAIRRKKSSLDSENAAAETLLGDTSLEPRPRIIRRKKSSLGPENAAAETLPGDSASEPRPRAIRRKKSSLDSENTAAETLLGDTSLEPRPRATRGKKSSLGPENAAAETLLGDSASEPRPRAIRRKKSSLDSESTGAETLLGDTSLEPRPRATRRKKSSLDSENAGSETLLGDTSLDPRPRAIRRKKVNIEFSEGDLSKAQRKGVKKASAESIMEAPSEEASTKPKVRNSRKKISGEESVVEASIKRKRASAAKSIDSATLVKPTRQVSKKKGLKSEAHLDADLRANPLPYLTLAYGSPSKISRKPLGDSKRMNILSERLCDDILERMGPSLHKHKGCDILDINPGVGIFSSKLHDYLNPRTHILVEPDVAVYQPFLQPLLDAPDSKYQLVPKSGIVWAHLETVLTKDYLPFQEPRVTPDPLLHENNDTLLLVANLGYNPKKVYRGFASLSLFVMYQFLSAIRSHALIQQYGRVRMLIWLNDDEKSSMNPRSVPYRMKSAMEADISCERIEEIASSTREDYRYKREQMLDFDRLQKVLARMKRDNVKIPAGRESIMMNDMADANITTDNDKLPSLGEAAVAELKRLKKSAAEGDLDKAVAMRFYSLNWRRKLNMATRRAYWKKAAEFDAILLEQRQLYEAPESEVTPSLKEAIADRIETWKMELENLSTYDQVKVRQLCDNRRTVAVDPPVLVWDRREAEPLRVFADEFFPKHEMALLDFQPRKLWSVLQGARDNQDVLEFIVATLCMNPTMSLKDAFMKLWPGAYEWFLEKCPLLTDPLKGGNEDLDVVSVRTMTLEMIEQILVAWIEWPWKPTRFEVMHRMGSSVYNEDELEDEQLK